MRVEPTLGAHRPFAPSSVWLQPGQPLALDYISCVAEKRPRKKREYTAAICTFISVVQPPQAQPPARAHTTSSTNCVAGSTIAANASV